MFDIMPDLTVVLSLIVHSKSFFSWWLFPLIGLSSVSNYFAPSEAFKMGHFTAVDLREMMEKKHNIRNVSVIAHINHGM